jgi:hypothetical protein
MNFMKTNLHIYKDACNLTNHEVGFKSKGNPARRKFISGE